MSGRSGLVLGRGRQNRRKPLTPDIFKWSDDFVRQMGWQSKRGGQETLRDEMGAHFLKMEQDSFKPGEGEQLRGLDPKGGKHWQRYVSDRQGMERLDPPRKGQMVEQLRQSAQAYLDHFDQDYSKREKSDPTNQRKRQECLNTLTELRKLDLRDEFARFGAPPWDSQTAMKAAAMKTTLDLESLPSGQCKKLDSDNVNPAFWVNKQDGNGTEKTFLFKPGSKFKADMNGFPAGGEPVREALAGRAADLLSGMTGIDFKMPETHVIEVGKDRFPDGAIDDEQSTVNGDKVMGSVQQYAATEGELRDLPREVMKKISPESCQSIAVLDVVSLNLDRHSGNLMIGNSKGQTPNVVPIDHGLSFPTNEGIAEIADNMGNDKNVLLKLAGSWQPFDNAMLDKIDQIDPDAFAGAMRKERDDIDGVVPGSGATMPDESIDLSRRSTMFLKLAARQLPPALVQVALGQNAETVLDPTIDDQEFTRRATQAIQATANMSAEYKEYFYLMGDEERLEMKERLKLNGWPTNNARLNERWMMANLKLALTAYKRNMLNPGVEREVLRGIDRNEMMNRLGRGEPLGEILTSVRRQAAGGARPLDLDDMAFDDGRDCLRAFPAMKLTIPPTNDEQRDKLRDAVAQWRELNAAGGMNALTAAIATLCLTPGNADVAREGVSKALTTVRDAATVQNLPPPPPDQFDQAAKEATLSFMETLLPYLPQDDRDHMQRRINGLRLQVATSVQLRAGRDVTEDYKDQIADLKDELIEDVAAALSTALDAAVLFMKNTLGMKDDEIGESSKGIRTQIRAGTVRAAGEGLARLKRSYGIP